MHAAKGIMMTDSLAACMYSSSSENVARLGVKMNIVEMR